MVIGVKTDTQEARLSLGSFPQMSLIQEKL